MDGDVDQVAALKALPYFSALAESELKQLAHSLVERTFEKDESIFLEGEPCHGVYIVRKGSVKVFKLSAEGREQILTNINSNGSFNEVAVFDGGPNPANATATASTVCWILPGDVIFDLIQHSPPVAVAIIRNLGTRLRRLVGLVEDLSLRQVIGRLAKLLLEPSFDEGLTQQEMAARLGTVREIIGRSLRQMELRGLIKVEHGKITIVDRAGLEKLV
jgi:CRP/FNR family transcriptional regulator, cyclic AMP receptor protein